MNADAARAALDELAETWGTRYAAIIRLWENAWEQFIPFLDYDVEIRTVLCSTNAIESLNARYRRAVKARGHFPTEQAALKCLYLVTRSLDPTGTGQDTMGRTVETSAQRIRHHLRRPLPGRRNLLTQTAGNTVSEIDPDMREWLPEDDLAFVVLDAVATLGPGRVPRPVPGRRARAGSI